MTSTKSALLLPIVAALAFIALAPLGAQAAAACDFTRNLDKGDEGPDVQCLQKFLNGAGYAIASSGGGAPGHETTTLGDKTAQAVAKWQKANGLSPAIGYFGAQSRAKYAALASGSDAAGAPAVPAAPSPSSGSSARTAQSVLNVSPAKPIRQSLPWPESSSMHSPTEATLTPICCCPIPIADASLHAASWKTNRSRP